MLKNNNPYKQPRYIVFMEFTPTFALIIQIFVLLNPLSSFPLLMSAYRQKMDVKKIAFVSVITAFVIAVIIALVGPSLFNLFGISLDSFRIAGGIVLLLLGLDTIKPKNTEQKKVSGVDSLVSIIATPLLTGPATISFITIKAYEIGQATLLFNLLMAFLLVGIVFVLFAYSVPKVNIVDISSRVLGLFLTAVAIEMIAKGTLALIGA
jgi:multiple antibiotic resistance protein